MRDRPLVSIIVPVYNVERYLNRCIKSIITQEYKELELFWLMMVLSMAAHCCAINGRNKINGSE